MIKKCSTCKQEKELSEFSKSKYSKDNYHNQCKSCFKEYHRKNKDKVKKQRKEYCSRPEIQIKRKEQLLIKKYNLTMDEYNKTLIKQGNKCGICLKEFTGIYPMIVCVDHNHSNNKVRGLLCYFCNAAIGMFSDNITILNNAINWIETRI